MHAGLIHVSANRATCMTLKSLTTASSTMRGGYKVEFGEGVEPSLSAPHQWRRVEWSLHLTNFISKLGVTNETPLSRDPSHNRGSV
jgi:hypothetical protein